MEAVVRFTRRYPRASGWIRARFGVGQPRGLALTVLVVVAVTSAWLTVGLAEDVLGRDGIAAFDPRAHSWIVGHRIGRLTAVLRIATYLGSNWVLLPVLAVSCVVFGWRRRSWRPALDITVVYLPAMILYSVIKDALRRPRPAASQWLTPASGWSFPSGHATQAAAAWGILAVLAATRRSARTKIAIGTGAAAIVLLVAFCRWYLGVHWLTDVLAGMALGIAVLSFWGVIRTVIMNRPDAFDRPPAGITRPVDQSPGSPPRPDGTT